MSYLVQSLKTKVAGDCPVAGLGMWRIDDYSLQEIQVPWEKLAANNLGVDVSTVENIFWL